MSRRIQVLALLLIAYGLVGCAGAVSPRAGVDASVAPTAACPQVEGVDLPPECAPYDPDHAMAQNDRYRERFDLTEEQTASMDELVDPLRSALEDVRASGIITAEAVDEAISQIRPLAHPQTRARSGDVLFGVAGPEGGCLYGAVTPEAVTVEVGGFIQDGGCLPAQ